MSTVNEHYRKIIEGHQEAIKAALTNEALTRQRVDSIEDLLRRGFVGRLKWVLKGR